MPKRDPAHMEQRRRQILDAAIACFRTEDYENTTMKQIGERAGLSIGALYTHFKNKREVMIAILEQEQGWSSAEEITSLAELERFLEQTAIALTGEDQSAYRMNINIAREAMNDPALNAALGTALRASFLVFRQMLARLQQTGRLSADYNVEAGAFRLHAISVGIIFWHYHDNTIDTSEVRAVFQEELERMGPVA